MLFEFVVTEIRRDEVVVNSHDLYRVSFHGNTTRDPVHLLTAELAIATASTFHACRGNDETWAEIESYASIVSRRESEV